MTATDPNRPFAIQPKMTEKAVSFEVHPMRGHAHGEWYGAPENIANHEEDAEYWALFGVTIRGNHHCLGEFRTKSEAEAAKRDAIDRQRGV